MKEPTCRHTAPALAALTLMAANCPEVPWALRREHVDAPRGQLTLVTRSLCTGPLGGGGCERRDVAVTDADTKVPPGGQCRSRTQRDVGRRAPMWAKPRSPISTANRLSHSPTYLPCTSSTPRLLPRQGLRSRSRELGKTGSWACPEPASRFQAERLA